jgi:hypothetical protein
MAEIMKVMDAAKEIMRSSGNLHQWTEGYPSEAVILSDMEKGGGYVVEEDSKIVGYFVLRPVSRHHHHRSTDSNRLSLPSLSGLLSLLPGSLLLLESLSYSIPPPELSQLTYNIVPILHSERTFANHHNCHFH